MNDIFNKIFNFVKSPKFYGPIIAILVAYIIYLIIDNIINKASIKGRNELEKKKRKTVILLAKNIIKYLLVIIVFLIILNIYGVNTNSLIAGLGVIGAVIGLAFQDALKDIIGGINIILDNYFVVGDLVCFSDFTGTIMEFGLKSTKIQNAKGEVLILANRNIDKIINLSQKKCAILLTIPTAYECDHKKVEKVLKSVLTKIKKEDDVSENDTEYLGIDSFAGSSINYLIRIKCKQGTQFAIKRLALKYIKEAYEENDLKIPYDQIEVHHGSDI